MLQMMIFINLFFCPVVCLYLLFRQKKKPVTASMELLVQYCSVVACNIPATKVFVFLCNRIAGRYIALDSGYYTLFALLSAVLLAWLFANVQLEISLKRMGTEEKAEEAIKEQLPQQGR